MLGLGYGGESEGLLVKVSGEALMGDRTSVVVWTR